MDNLYTFDWYDGPRSGVADYNGRPHFYESQWADIGELEDWFKLSPVPEEVFEQALEYWRLWKKWQTAHAGGTVGTEHHPFLPIDRPRGEELLRILSHKLKIDETDYLIAQADFAPVDELTCQSNDVEMLVHWKVLETAPSESRKGDYDL